MHTILIYFAIGCILSYCYHLFSLSELKKVLRKKGEKYRRFVRKESWYYNNFIKNGKWNVFLLWPLCTLILFIILCLAAHRTVFIKMSTEENTIKTFLETIPFVDYWLLLDDKSRDRLNVKLLKIAIDLNADTEHPYGTPMWYQMTKSKIGIKLLRF